jgi:hypothetical protein
MAPTPRHRLLLLPEVQAVAQAHNVTPAQVVFRFLTQQGHPLVTASGSQTYDTEDLYSLGFNLTAVELTMLKQVKASSCWNSGNWREPPTAVLVHRQTIVRQTRERVANSKHRRAALALYLCSLNSTLQFVCGKFFT